ncbi:MAG: hypothetical protein R3F43_05730 [bacterium]
MHSRARWRDHRRCAAPAASAAGGERWEPILHAWRYEAPGFDLPVGLERLEERRIVPGSSTRWRRSRWWPTYRAPPSPRCA